MFKLKYKKNNGIYTFIKNNDFSKIIDTFYSVEPFPSYAKDDNKLSLLNKGNQNLIAKKLKNEIGFGKKILEVGSGTAQLSQYFALGTNNDVTALDATYASLKLGREFSFKNKIPNINFVNGDIFDEIFEENIFDLVWCSGVLHHTKNPKKGFKQITKYLKRDGYIVIGLYNLYGRLFTKLRQVIYKFLPIIFKRKFIMLADPYLRILKNNKSNFSKINSWIRDQYEHPHESLHTIDEVLRWFNEEKIEFINSIPVTNFEDNLDSKILSKINKGTFFERTINQILMLFSTYGKEGGLFIVIGKK